VLRLSSGWMARGRGGSFPGRLLNTRLWSILLRFESAGYRIMPVMMSTFHEKHMETCPDCRLRVASIPVENRHWLRVCPKCKARWYHYATVPILGL
jgi:hypothetical protein